MIYRGRRLLPSGDLRGHVAARLQSLQIGERDLVFVPSPVCREVLDLLARGLGSGHDVVWLELEPSLRHALENGPEIPPEGRARLHRWDPALPASALDLPWHRYRRVVELSLTGGRNLHPEAYARRRTELEEVLSTYWQNRLTWSQLGPLWVRNLWRNLTHLRPSSLVLPEHPRVVVVVGAGPSLDGKVDILRQERSRLWILAVDSALSTLLETGIEPDLTAVLEAQPTNLRDLCGAPRPLPVVADLTSHPSLVRTHGPPLLWTLSQFAPLSLLRRLEAAPALDLPALGSVGNYALELALRLWEGPVFVCGLDWTFLPGQTHARGSAQHRHLLGQNSRFEGLEGHDLLYRHGGADTPALRAYRRIFEAQARDRVSPLNRSFLGMVARPRGLDAKTTRDWGREDFLQTERQKLDRLWKSPELDEGLAEELSYLWFWTAEYPRMGDPQRLANFLRIQGRKILSIICSSAALP